MTKSEEHYCYQIAKSIRESFEESGYLRKDELREYVIETVNIEYENRSNKHEFVNFIFNLINKNSIYKEFLKGNNLMCSQCEIIKPLSQFNTYKYKGETLNKTICKKCEYKKHKIWIQNNKDKQREHNKKRYENNKELYKKKHLEYIKNNPDKRKLYNKQYRAKSLLKNRLNRELTDLEIKLINDLVKKENLTGLKIFKSGVIEC